MGRAPCCDKANVKKGPWSPEEDRKLKEYIEKHGAGGNWIVLPQKAGLRRCGKSCRLRWLNYLRPNIKHGEFSDDEDRVICTLFASIGSRWSIMAAQLPGRTDNDIKNYWNTKLKKKMMNTLISMPYITKPYHHHHLQPYNSSSLPNFQNSNNININDPLQSSSSSSYLYDNNPSSYNHDQTLSIPSSPKAASNHHPILQSSHGYMNVGSMENYQVGKDRSTLLMFGGDQAASCSSNSDGSCHYEYGSVGVYDQNNMGIGGDYEKGSGYYGDSSLDSSLEEFKQLISTNLCTSNIDNNLNFFVDENKEEEKVMYY